MEERKFYIYIVDWESFWDGKEGEYSFTIWSFQESHRNKLKRLIISPEPVSIEAARNSFTRPVMKEVRVLEPWEVEYYKDDKYIATVIYDKYDRFFEMKKMAHDSVKLYHEREDGAILNEFEIIKLIFQYRSKALVIAQFETLEDLL